jgi:hypothetical protein
MKMQQTVRWFIIISLNKTCSAVHCVVARTLDEINKENKKKTTIYVMLIGG